jgi:hypothetical protein
MKNLRIQELVIMNEKLKAQTNERERIASYQSRIEGSVN